MIFAVPKKLGILGKKIERHAAAIFDAVYCKKALSKYFISFPEQIANGFSSNKLHEMKLYEDLQLFA